jgi:hypothetical protein
MNTRDKQASKERWRDEKGAESKEPVRKAKNK